MTFGEKLIARYTEAATKLGRRLNRPEYVSIADEVYKEATKERKRSGVDERASSIFNVYPRREGGQAALLAISKSISEDGFEHVLERTTIYASAVARWAPNRKKAPSGSSLIPLPTTWFGNKRYKDDEKQWWEGTGKQEHEEKEKLLLAEPAGWRFAHPESRFVTENIAWGAIDVATQRWIIENTPKQRAHG